MRLTPEQGSIRVEEHGTRLYIRWYVRDPDVWREVLDSFKFAFPRHGDRTFDPEAKLWSVPLWHRDHLAEWADRWFTYDAQSWPGDDDGPSFGHGHAHTNGQSRYGHYDCGGVAASTLDSAYALLWLKPNAPLGLVEAAYRWWAKQIHPDTGHGDSAAMARINGAVDEIKAACG